MKGRQVLQLLLVIGVLVALVLAWPKIAKTARNPRIGDWVPTEDPGTQLLVGLVAGQGAGRQYALAIGAVNFSCDINCELTGGSIGYGEVDVKVYGETDGELGDRGEPCAFTLKNTSPATSPTENIAGFAGYQPNGHLLVEILFSDSMKTKAMVGPPMNFQPGAETGWQPLAAIWDLGVLLEWSQTKEHLLIRRSGLPGQPAPTWSGGSFLVGDKGCQFTDDTQIARLFRARVPSHRKGDQNVNIIVTAEDEGITTIIRVK